MVSFSIADFVRYGVDKEIMYEREYDYTWK